MRHPLLYAEEQWRRQRWVVFLVFPYGIGVGFFYLFIQHGPLSGIGQSTVGIIGFGLLIYLVFQLYRRRNFVQVTDAGVKVSRLLGSYVVPYESIRSARVQPLKSLGSEVPSRAMTPITKALWDRPALFLRLGGDEEEVAAVRKALNRPLANRLVFGSAVALPIVDPDGAAEELAPHLPLRAAPNLGGGRRSKRRR